MIDVRRLNDLFAAHAGPLTLYARQLDAADADELVQEAFIRLLSQRDEPPAVRPWLLTTVRRLAIDRRRAWFRRRCREQSAQPAAWFVPTNDDAIDARHAALLLATLPERQREVVVLRIWNDLTLAQIATLVGIAPATAHADLHAGLAALRNRMETTHATP